MSKAFTRESDDAPDELIAPRALSVLPPGAKNYLTENGAQCLREELSGLIQRVRPELAGDETRARELQRVNQRILELEEALFSAEIVALPEEDQPEHVTFGSTVTVRDTRRTEKRYRIVGVSESDPGAGAVSWVSPLARALLRRKRGERVIVQSPSGEEELEIVDIGYER